MQAPKGVPSASSPDADTGGIGRLPPARVGRGGAPPAHTEARGPMRRIFGALREAVERLVSPYTTSEQLLDALRRVEGIRTAAEISERRWLESQLRQAQKLEIVGQLAGGIAHDFNNILAVILANTEMLRSSLPFDRPDLIDSVDKIRAAASGGAGMVRGLLTFSRRADLTVTALDLREVVANTGQMVRALLPDDVEIKIVVPPAACPVRGDAAALQQLLLNLVTNARDAMPSGGTLIIEAMQHPTDQSFPESVPWVNAEAFYCVAVSDTGVGMDQTTVEKIFEPFFTTKAPGAGTGLGMAMVYGIAKQHGGFVHVYSELGAGTSVKLYLPKSAEGAVAATVATGETAPHPGGGETILLVEDRDELRGTTRRVLERLGYTVVEAVDGEDALAKQRAHAGAIDLVLSDVLMPKLTGPALFRAVRETDPGMRFLFTSGYSENDIAMRSLLDPGVPFVAKPWAIADLARQVRAALDGPPVAR
jgi:two-component system, cell cycle sensor histidine kinase and response regulator CckA